MKLEEIRGKPDAELRTLLDTSREELWKMRMKATTEPIDNPGKIREMRKRIAWISGELRTRELKIVRERIRGELASGSRTTRELAKAIGRSETSAQVEALRLARKGEIRQVGRPAPNCKQKDPPRSWELKKAARAAQEKK